MKEGDIFRAKAPYLREKIGDYWLHGINFESDEYCQTGKADAEGLAEFEVIKIVRLPEPYKERVFFRRRLTNPDGHTEKWRNLEMLGLKAFERVRTGGKWNYEIIW